MCGLNHTERGIMLQQPEWTRPILLLVITSDEMRLVGGPTPCLLDASLVTFPLASPGWQLVSTLSQASLQLPCCPSLLNFLWWLDRGRYWDLNL